MTGHPAPNGRGIAEALPMPSGYFSLILRTNADSPERARALLEGTGLSGEQLDPTDDITLGQQLQQIRNAARTLEPGWALRTGSQLTAVTHGANGVAIVCAPSMREGLDVMTRFAHVRAPHFGFRALQRDYDEVRIVPEDRVPLTDQERNCLLELVLLSTQAVIEARIGRPMSEGRFELPFPEPEHAALYRELFHAPVRFGCPQAAVVVPATWLSIESPFADHALYRGALQQVHRGARLLQGDQLLAARVEQLLARRGARLGLSNAARLLGVSERTLNRRLADQGTSFQTLVNHSLRARALALLQDRELSVAEVAYTLGYGDAANFSRAFRRWFGQPPGSYRASLEGGETLSDPLG